MRIILTGAVLLAGLAYLLVGTILARNVTFNVSNGVDEGAYNGIRRYGRETIMSVWQTMWDRAPAFGSIDLTRFVLLTSTVLFFLAFAFIVVTVFVPSRREWTSGLDDGQSTDAAPGD